VFTGKDMLFDGKARPKFPDSIKDGFAQTFLVVEAAEAVPWTKPIDLDYAADRPLPRLGLEDGFFASLADGSTRFVGKMVSEQTIRAAITPNGKDLLGVDWLE